MEAREPLAEALWNSKVLTKGQASNIASHLLEDFVVIPRSEVPIVGEDEWRGVNAPPAFHVRIRDLDGRGCSEKHWLIALLEIARAEHYQKEEAAIARQKENKALQKRRDELASQFTAVNSYNGQLPYTQKLIDHIIFLEGASK